MTLLKEIEHDIPKEAIFYMGEGCQVCGHSGYSGREMISEVLMISETISRMIAGSAAKEDIRIQARKEGFISMFENGIHKALAGETSLEEIYRVGRV